MNQKSRYVPLVVDDFASLDVRIADYLRAHSYTAETQLTMEKAWGWWSRHCRDFKVDEYGAPLEVFEAALLARRLDGRPYSSSHLANVLAAVRNRYATEGLVPAPDRAENRVDWQMLTKGRRNEIALQRARGGLATVEHVPLTRESVTRMLVSAVLPRSENQSMERQADAVCAASLLALDTSLSRTTLVRLNRCDLEELNGGAIRVLEHVLNCDHRARERGVPWDCTVCSLRTVLQAHDGRSPALFQSAATRQEISRWLLTRARAWPALQSPGESKDVQQPAFLLVPNATSWQAAGLRRGLVINARQPHNINWVRGRAWVALSFEAGLRMCSDLARLPRSAVWMASDRAGWRLRLGATKDDPTAQKRVSRLFRFRDDDGPSAALALAEYLCVRDAAAGDEGPLLLGARGGLLAATRPLMKPVQAAKFDLDLLCQLAGLPQQYTSYSTRKGYGHQTSQDGWELEKTMQGLRHKKPDTTLLYTGSQGGKRVARKLLAAVEESTR